MTVTIAVQSPAVRLNLVDRHRDLFYEMIDDYDLFIYSEVSSICEYDYYGYNPETKSNPMIS
jgi:hypothetical protein